MKLHTEITTRILAGRGVGRVAQALAARDEARKEYDLAMTKGALKLEGDSDEEYSDRLLALEDALRKVKDAGDELSATCDRTVKAASLLAAKVMEECHEFYEAADEH